MEENDIKIKSVFSKESRKYIAVAVIVATIIMGVLDTRLQSQYGELSSAYSMMDDGRYIDAMIIFEEYMGSHSPLFWEMERFVNGDDSDVGFNKVSEAIEICRKGTDIVNIGLHFILKNVRPYAASCSEA